MKTKFTFILVAAMMALGVNAVKAEGTTTSNNIQESGNVTLNINLHMIQSIVVNPGQTTIDFDYKTKQNYADGVSVPRDKHLNIYSTGGFKVNAVAISDKLDETINVNDILLTSKNNDANNKDATCVTDKELFNGKGTTIITSGKGGVDLNFDITYKAAGENKYINLFKNGENPTKYTTTINYTIVPQ